MIRPRLKLDVLVQASGGTVVQQAGDTFTGASIDTRTLEPGALFFALRGNRDGHDFLTLAVRNGAAGLVVEPHRNLELPPGVTVVTVPDPRTALGQFGAAVRRRMDATVIGVTGSNGKTTTKELLAAALGEETLKTEGNLNNELGVPLTLLRLMPAHRYAVIEMGMRGPGEIAALARLSRPRIGIITSIGPAHLETLGSIEAIAAAKGELFDELVAMAPSNDGGPNAATMPSDTKADRVAIFPDDEPLLGTEAAGAHAVDRCLSFGSSPLAASRILRAEPQGILGTRVELRILGESIGFLLPLIGMHNVRNAAAAALGAFVAGRSLEQIAAGLAKAKPVKQRCELVEVGGRHVLVDLYNANPSSTRAALSTLATLRTRGTAALAVLGDMLELGEQTVALHREIGEFAQSLGLDGIIGVGALGEQICVGAAEAGMERKRLVQSSDKRQAAASLAHRTKPGDWILIKGSRGMKMEEVFEAFQEELR